MAKEWLSIMCNIANKRRGIYIGLNKPICMLGSFAMQYKKFTYFLLGLAPLFFLFTSPARAATYYVDQNNSIASDSNLGTESLPWKTLKKATKRIAAGDTVYVKAGTYIDFAPTGSGFDDFEIFNPDNSGTRGKPITFISSPRLAAIVRLNGLPFHGLPAWKIRNRSYIVIDGFKIEGGFAFDNSQYCILKNAEVTMGRTPDFPGIYFTNGSVAIQVGDTINLEKGTYCNSSNPSPT